jgi:hypothetical protein
MYDQQQSAESVPSEGAGSSAGDAGTETESESESEDDVVEGEIVDEGGER